MSKILISGCGITFPGERPTWAKIFKICKLNITDLSGPAISNYLILNQLLEEINCNTYSHVICQLTSMGKLDVQLTEKNRFLMETDTVRNFEYRGYWPSSESLDHEYKRIWREYLYSPEMEKQDIVYKIELLTRICKEKTIKLYIIQGYDIGLDEYNISDDYKKDSTYQLHDHTNGNNVPCLEFQIKLAKKINENFLQMNLPLEKFDE